MKPGDTTPIAFVDTETLSLNRMIWEAAVILADLTCDDFHGDFVRKDGTRSDTYPGRPRITVTGTWAGFLDVERNDLRSADPNSLRLNRFYARHPRYRFPAAERTRRPALIHHGDDDGIPYGTYYGGDGPENLVWDRDAAAYELARLLAGRTIIGAIPWFDTGHLKDLCGPQLPFHYHLVDVEALLAGWLAGVNTAGARNAPAVCLPTYSTRDLADLAGITRLDETAHEAWADARWCVDVVAHVWDAQVVWPTPDGWEQFEGLLEHGAAEPADHKLLGDLLPDDAEIITHPDGSHQLAPQDDHWDPGSVDLRRLVDRPTDDGYPNLAAEPDRDAYKFPFTSPIIYMGQPVQWDDGRNDQGLTIVRTGILREYIAATDDNPHRWALVDVEYADGKGQPVHVRLDRLRHAATLMGDAQGRRRGEPGFEDDFAGRARAGQEPPRATAEDIRAARGSGGSFIVEHVDYGEDAAQGPPGNPTRNIIASVEEALAARIEAACHKAGITFDSDHDRATTIGLLAGLVAEETGEATRRAEGYRADWLETAGLVKEMHEAATGRKAPKVSYVSDLRNLRDAYQLLLDADTERRKPPTGGTVNAAGHHVPPMPAPGRMATHQ